MHRDTAPAASSKGRYLFGLCAFLAVALFFLWEEHRAHILGAVPYLLLLLCPLMHLFMHRGHTDHGGREVRRELH